MKKLLLISCCCLGLLLVGCSGMRANPYELTDEMRKELKPNEQKEYIEMIKSIEEIVSSVNDEQISYDEDMKKVKALVEKCPKDWNWKKDDKPIDEAWRYVMQLMDALLGCRNYGNYADCKDAIDEMAKDLSKEFKRSSERCISLFIDENRFYSLYKEGKGEKSDDLISSN